MPASKVIQLRVAYNKDMFPAIFLDRDGVVIENRDDYVREWSHVHLLPNAIDALSGFHREGFKVIVVTNQAVIGRGFMTLDDAHRINERLLKTVKELDGWIDGIFMCPHKPEDNCICRKPQPGLLLQAAREFSIDLSTSWMVGDAWTDLQAGQAAGVQGTVMVRTGRGTAQLDQVQPREIQPFVICEDIFDAFNHIVLFQKNEPAQD